MDHALLLLLLFLWDRDGIGFAIVAFFACWRSGYNWRYGARRICRAMRRLGGVDDGAGAMAWHFVCGGVGRAV